jgi:hypothetical protein
MIEFVKITLFGDNTNKSSVKMKKMILLHSRKQKRAVGHRQLFLIKK